MTRFVEFAIRVRLLATCAMALLAVPVAQGGEQWSIPFFPSASDPLLNGLVRFVNRSGESGEVRIVAVDDAGREYGPLMLPVAAYGAAHLTSDDLELGNEAIGLEGSTGSGQGDWRLELTSDVDFEALCYVSDANDFLTSMNAVARVEDGAHRVLILNPGRNSNQIGVLRLINPGSADARATVRATDDMGERGGELTIPIPAGEAQTWHSAELESGGSGLEGALGSGSGKWRLVVESVEPIVVMSLQSNLSGHLTNLSRLPANEQDGVYELPLLPPVSDPSDRHGFVRVINRSADDGEASVAAFDDSTWQYEPFSLLLRANGAAHFNSFDLEQGNTSKGLVGVGAGQGDWRLTLTSDLDISVIPYIRTGSGFVTAMHDTAVGTEDGSHRYYLPLFQPAGYAGQEGRLRLRNLGAGDAEITITGLDDQGRRPPGGSVRLNLAAGAKRTLTSVQLEQGAEDVCGRFGAGSGKWQLFVSADRPVETMGLGQDERGLYENLSRGRAGYFEWPFANPLADLVVEAIWTSGNTVRQGQVFALSATVHNGGDGPSTPTALRCYRSTDATISPTDVQVCTGPVGCLGGNSSADLRASLSAPAEPGTYYYGACVDAVSEEYTANNCSAGVRVVVQVDGLDLVVDTPSASDGAPLPGGSFALSTTVRNHGDVSSAATMLRYYRSADKTITRSDTAVGMDDVSALGASGTSNESITLTAPSTPGRYYYGACVDAVEGESDTGNNCSTALAVTVRAAGPDLVVEAVPASDAGPLTGGSFTLSATVRNQGDVSSAATTLRYYRSADATILESDTAVGTDGVPVLSTSGTSGQSIETTAPLTSGTYYYGACVDAVEGESDTGNNCSTALAVTVRAGPDLVVGAVSANDAGPLTGGSFTLSATVRNQGDMSSAATTLRYYRSADATILESDTAVGTDGVPVLSTSGTSGQSIETTAPLTSGTYYYGACVDAVEGESDTGNNCSTALAVTVRAGPDLVVGAVSANDAGPLTGGSFTLSATVRNQGDMSSAATTLHYYRSADATISESDTAVGTDGVPVLSTSGTSGQSIETTAPLTSGTYYYGACVDAVEGESDTGNNCSTALAVTVRAGPDLVVGTVSANDAGPLTGGSFTLSATVRNQGDMSSAATTLRYYRSADATILESDTAVGTDGVPVLSTSGTSGQSIEFAAPLTLGTYYYGACVDAVERESDTGNNCSTALAVTVRAGPDLVVGTVSANEPGLLTGGSFTLSATVRNQGDVSSAATTLRYYRSADATITRSGAAVGTDWVAPLDASDTSGESIEFTAPLTSGTYYYGACVDAVVGESDTGNNCSDALEVTVRTADMDLEVGAISASDAEPLPGRPFTLSATVHNQGSASSPATTLRYYRSADATISGSDTAVGTDRVAPLDASGTSGESINLTAPWTAGLYHYGACVDAVVGESDAGNNCSTAATVTVPSRSDLTVVNPFTRYDPPLLRSNAFTLLATVRNRGNAPMSEATTLRYYRSADATISDSDTAVGTDGVTVLGASSARRESIDLTTPSAPGTYYYGGCVDTVRNDLDTMNNCSVAATVTVLRGPDLISRLTARWGTCETVRGEGPDGFGFWAIVTNRGDALARGVIFDYYRSSDATITMSDSRVSRFSHGTTGAGTLYEFFKCLPTPTEPGTYYFGGCVAVVPEESDTSNNCAAGSFELVIPEPAS